MEGEVWRGKCGGGGVEGSWKREGEVCRGGGGRCAEGEVGEGGVEGEVGEGGVEGEVGEGGVEGEVGEGGGGVPRGRWEREGEVGGVCGRGTKVQ